jgi:hypothetical protein
MTIILTAKEVLELSKWYLDIEPNPDNVHSIAEKMDMKYMELMDMWWDVEQHSLSKYKFELDIK